MYDKIKKLRIRDYKGADLETPIRIKDNIKCVEVKINKELRVIHIKEFANLMMETINKFDATLHIAVEDYIIFKRAFFNQPRDKVIKELDRLYVMAKL